jgi:hypothetical protein
MIRLPRDESIHWRTLLIWLLLGAASAGAGLLCARVIWKMAKGVFR